MLVASLLLWEIVHIFLGGNFHEVVPGRVYRGSLPSPARLEWLVKTHGIRTVVNLRGLCNPLPWYLDECRAAQNLGINLEDVALCACRLPPAPEVRRLVKVLENAEEPIYFHCYRGADRTGLACVMAKILLTDANWDEARRQLHWRYGHVAVARPAYLDDFFDLYTHWLAEQKREHSREAFRHWALNVYHGGWCDYQVEEFHRLGSSAGDLLPPHEPIAYRVKVKNTGPYPWKNTPYVASGMHLGYRVRDIKGENVLEGRSGMREGVVEPGQSFEATVVLPATLGPGRYLVTIDMVDENMGWFFQAGLDPVEEEFVIRE